MSSSQTEPEPAASPVVYRKPRLSDAAGIHSLVEQCKPLDLNSTYAYMLLCAHFAETCAVAERNSRLLGFISGYQKPGDETVLFVWQVAVSPQGRGQGIGKQLLEEVLARPSCQAVRHIETTITPSNRPSRALFESFAKRRNAACKKETMFQAGDFGGEEHEEEQLLRIGPLKSNT